MCGRYALFNNTPDEKMLEMIDLCNRAAQSCEQIVLREDGEVFPCDFVPALILANGRVKAVSMRWGIENASGKLIINARSEDVHKNPFFSDLEKKGRCLLPAFAYFEWRRGDKTKYIVTGDGPIYLAGLYRTDDSGIRKLTILTKEAEGKHADVHHRMPVVIANRLSARRWLSDPETPVAMSGQSSETLQIKAVGAEQMMIDFTALV